MSNMSLRFKFTPSLAITRRGPYDKLSIARKFAAYQWYCSRLHAYNNMRRKKDRDFRSAWEYLNDTSSIHNSASDPIFDFDAPFKRLASLFAWVGDPGEGRGEFLRYCKLRKWTDLAKPFIIPIAHTNSFPQRSWFELRGREFKVSPNTSHPPATWIMSGSVQLNQSGTLWKLRIEYGYKHDSSHWFYDIYQEKSERLVDFVHRASTEMEKLLVPESDWLYTGSHRLAAERDWAKSHDALKTIFYDQHLRMIGWEDKLADMLAGIPGASLSEGRITLSSARLQTLQRWIEETQRAAKAREAKEKKEQAERQRQGRGY